MTSPLGLSLILPCRNQGDHLGPLLPRFHDALSQATLRAELVLVPNASTDQTADIARDFAARHANVKVVDNPHGGWGLSVRMGLDAAEGEVVGYTNSARTDPMVLPEFVARYRENAPCLLKARRFDRAAPLRSLGSALYNVEARLLFGISARDVNGTPKLFPRDFYRALTLHADGDLLDLEIMAAARRARLPVVELPLPGFRRHGGKSSTNLRSAWNMYAGAVALWARSLGGQAQP